MPEISRFLGIVITMYYNDHAPPHFHAKYSGFDVKIRIDTGEADGFFPRRALTLVKEWCELHRAELTENWRLSRERKPLSPVDPLE